MFDVDVDVDVDVDGDVDSDVEINEISLGLAARVPSLGVWDL